MGWESSLAQYYGLAIAAQKVVSDKSSIESYIKHLHYRKWTDVNEKIARSFLSVLCLSVVDQYLKGTSMEENASMHQISKDSVVDYLKLSSRVFKKIME
ncbi:hypothetical protein [Jeotgalibacillus proteolyticus]|uniref:Uncharacterized protein n=1 Tax=Jeotgalibacillus proteolyticus TaxID=2082395 RepID=A0A2S5GB02_9BACL|nr:hypothetical protein [Jeotgalibacillus proteolyticus]PPA70176.1 hypothetical protein C4B60_11355 [Jeotgalibacillus proteolyticus]